jgi:hypothetical protein
MISDAGVVAIVVLIVLLIQRDVVRTWLAGRRDFRWRVLDIAAAPLFLVFIVIVTARFVELAQ